MSKLKILLIPLIIALLFTASCAASLTALESDKEREYYDAKYANEPLPSPLVQDALDFLDDCVGGNYIYGAQGNPVTTDFVLKSNEKYEAYFSHGRLNYFLAIAKQNEQQGYEYPNDYAWDCSGLWWNCANELNLYEVWTDMTAAQTYALICTPITKDELRPGDIVFYRNDEDRISHMGIVGTHGYIYEAVSGFVGVVKKRTIDKRIYNDIVRDKVLQYDNWNVFGRPIIYE